MKPGYRVIGAFFSLLCILGYSSLTQNGSRLLMKPVLAIVTGSVNDPSPKTATDSQNINPDEQESKKLSQTAPNPFQKDSLDNSTEKTLIEQILNHQTQEGNAILQEEIRLRLQEIREQLEQFERGRQQEKDNAFKIKGETLNRQLARSLQDKTAENQVVLQKYESDLEESQKVNLVNIRLRLIAISLDRKSNSFNEEEQELNDHIEQIRQDIHRKVEDRKSQLSREYQQFEAEARQTSAKELVDFKTTLEKEFRKDYAALKGELEKELLSWRDIQEKKLNESIRLRKNKM